MTDTPDPDTANNTDQATVSVISQADLSVTKTTRHDPVIAGGTFAYSITVRNEGPSLARDVTLTDTLPAEVSFVSATPSQGTCAGPSPVVCKLGMIPSGGYATVGVTVDLTSGFTGTVNNTAEVTAAGVDPVTSNNVVGLPTNVVCELPVYDNNFSGSVGPEWSDPERDTTPNGHEFLGQFGNTSNNLAQFATLSDHGSVTLRLSDLPDHETVHLEFDLYVIRSWDGNTVIDSTVGPDHLVGPDRWSARIGDGNDDGTKLIDTTFSNWSHQRQAYPGSYPSSDQPAQTGATAVNTLGYWFEDREMDAVYEFAFTRSHDADTLEVDFGAFGLQELSDESWGLDNVKVRLSGCWPQHQQFLPVTFR